MSNTDLRRAFPAMPEDCRAALSRAARSVKEEHNMKKSSVAILMFAIVVMMTTIAIAEGWNVLQYLDITPGSGVDGLVQPVSASTKDGDVSFAIDSAITDGEYLVFDWTVNNTGEKPAFFQLESYTANSVGIYNDCMSDDFDCHWHDGMMQGGTISSLPADLEGDTLHVEMVIGAYTPIKPVYTIAEDEDFDETLAREKLDAGYFVRYGYDCWAIEDPDEGRVFAGWHKITDAEAEGFTRNELVLRFDLDLKAGRASRREIELPEPVTVEGITFAYTKASVSPLQIHLTATLTSATGDPEIIMTMANARYTLRMLDSTGNEQDGWDWCGSLMGEGTMEKDENGGWYCKYDTVLLAPNANIPEPFRLRYSLPAGQLAQFPDGLQIVLPISLSNKKVALSGFHTGQGILALY